MPEEIDGDKIAENAAAPRRASNAEGSMEQHSIQDQIAADKYKRSVAASTGTGKGLGFRMVRFSPPGTVQ